jgi:hypothetical protein
MKRVVNFVWRVVRHPLWLGTAVTVIAISFVVNQEWTRMYWLRGDVEEYFYGPNDEWIPDVNTTYWLGIYIVYRDAERNINTTKILHHSNRFNPDLDSIRDENGVLNILPQIYYINFTGVPQGIFFWAYEKIRFEYWSREYFQPEIMPLMMDGLDVRFIDEGEYDVSEIVDLLIRTFSEDSHEDDLIRDFDSRLRESFSTQSMKGKIDFVRVMWPGVIFETVAILLSLSGVCTLGYMPFRIFNTTRSRRRRRRGLCLKCGYCLNGVDSSICPECGTQISPSPSPAKAGATSPEGEDL